MIDLARGRGVLISCVGRGPRTFIGVASTRVDRTDFVSGTAVCHLYGGLSLTKLSRLGVLISTSIKSCLGRQGALSFGCPVRPGRARCRVAQAVRRLCRRAIISSLGGLSLRRLQRTTSLVGGIPSVSLCASTNGLFFTRGFGFRVRRVNEFIGIPVRRCRRHLATTTDSPSRLSVIISCNKQKAIVPRVIGVLGGGQSPVLLVASASTVPFTNTTARRLCVDSGRDRCGGVSSFSAELSLLFLLSYLCADCFGLSCSRGITVGVSCCGGVDQVA